MPVRRDSRGQWRYRKVVRLPDGRRIRISGTPATNTKSACEGAERDHIARVQSPADDRTRKEEAPTLNRFQREFMETYVAANNKPSERMSKEYMFKHHLLPWFGRRRLDDISTRDIERFKAGKLAAGLSPKTVNNFLTCLGKTLRYAAESELIEKLPRIKFVKVHHEKIDFLDFDEYARLLEAARADSVALAAILLAGDAGLRVGEIRALKWGDLDLKTGRLTVQRTDYRGHMGSPKGGRSRTLPMTRRLCAALVAMRHLKGPFVFCLADGRMWNRGHVETPLRRARKRAGLRRFTWHKLRHTFCSHLAMKGAPVRTIQELAGHASLTTTQRYMHLTPDAARAAIRLLEARGKTWQQGGNSDARLAETAWTLTS